MTMFSNISNNYYEVFEIHTLPRGLYALTLRINKKDASQFFEGKGNIDIPIGALTVHIGLTEEAPPSANFFVVKDIGNDRIRVSITKSFKDIHKRVDAIKDALNHTDLHIFLDNKYHNPYSLGRSYGNKGIYHGINEEQRHGTMVKYHYFTNNINKETKEYFNDRIL